jgi:hypothetical protein
VDRFSEKYSSLSSYQFSANNPINIIDINGDSLDVSGLMNSKNHVAAFALFATSKEGKAWLDNYAAAGQEVVYNGITLYKAKKDGKYHSEGINLQYSLNASEERSKVSPPSMNEQGGIDISIEIARSSYGSKNVLFNLTKAITHESFIHADLNTKDFLDNRKMDESNLGIYKGYGKHSDHYFVSRAYGNNRTNSNSLWPSQGERVLIRANNILNVGLTGNQINSIMWSFSGTRINVDPTSGKIIKN